jgi:hypothetical protein
MVPGNGTSVFQDILVFIINTYVYEFVISLLKLWDAIHTSVTQLQSAVLNALNAENPCLFKSRLN